MDRNIIDCRPIKLTHEQRSAVTLQLSNINKIEGNCDFSRRLTLMFGLSILSYLAIISNFFFFFYYARLFGILLMFF